ncbi:OsmC family peroxiredoxin [bacterium]|nr:OsmC family peroxiredoxin [bacterium]
MTADELKALQAPLKAQYRETPDAARQTMCVTGQVDVSSLSCRLETAAGPVDSGLHPAAGGSGEEACSGDMLLEALIACAGVTFSAVATAMSIPIESASITAEGVIDFRGTLGISKDVPIGFESIKLTFNVQSDAPRHQIEKLVELAERYCVILQTLKTPPSIETSLA